MGDLADDINEVFSLQSSVFKAVETLEERTDPSRCAKDVLLPPDALRDAHGIAFLWTYKVGVFLSLSAGNGLVMRRRVTASNETQWSLPSAVAMGGVGGGFDFGAACSSVVVVWSQQAVTTTGAHVKIALDAQACAGRGRAAEGAVNVTPTSRNDLDARQSGVRHVGGPVAARAHATLVTTRDAQNEEYYRRRWRHGHPERLRVRRRGDEKKASGDFQAPRRAPARARRGRCGGIVGGSDTRPGRPAHRWARGGGRRRGGIGVGELEDGVQLGRRLPRSKPAERLARAE